METIDEELDLDYLINCRDFYSRDDIHLHHPQQCQEILDSEAFEVYVRVVANRNWPLIRKSLLNFGFGFLIDLLKCTKAASDNWASALAVEGITFQEYQQSHYCECMMYRDQIFGEVMLPQEPETYTEHQIPFPTNDEISKLIANIREWPDVFGWKAFKPYLDPYPSHL